MIIKNTKALNLMVIGINQDIAFDINLGFEGFSKNGGTKKCFFIIVDSVVLKDLEISCESVQGNGC